MKKLYRTVGVMLSSLVIATGLCGCGHEEKLPARSNCDREVLENLLTRCVDVVSGQDKKMSLDERKRFAIAFGYSGGFGPLDDVELFFGPKDTYPLIRIGSKYSSYDFLFLSKEVMERYLEN
jgi:hypothetical protein